ncbi:MAG TPA: quinolinate synthase NadA [Gemmatales bacterium]|nr:quinolinate synthase NadA [Gemmatales bacterium]HMP58675.1 quinolinate synthase NadA [Gemmatales bacterium]
MPLPVLDAPAPGQPAPPSFEPYRRLSDDELTARCWAAKKQLGDRLLILGHHYQQDEVIAFADLRGDSYRLASLAAESKACRYIVFCGVHFMAETADILTGPEVQVVLPDLAAGCSMADMADIDQVEACWEDLGEVLDTMDIMPVTYINSAANLKAFCGARGGIVCTSSNARAVLDWSFAQRSKVLFFPDQHLGRNTAKKMGIPLDEMVLWDPLQPQGGTTPEQLRQARVLLWKGHCSVHQMFKVQHVEFFRQHHPAAQILVHPECAMEVVDLADLVGSTEYILRTVREAPAGSEWAIGTELHLVNRLKAEHPDKTVHFLSTMVCMCATMYRIDLPHLCWVLENLVQGVVVNRIVVPPDVAINARLALERMLTVR